MAWKRTAITLILSVLAGVVFFAILGFVVAKLIPGFASRVIPLANDMIGNYDPAQLAAGHGAYYGAVFGFLSGVVIVVVNALGKGDG